MRGLLVCRMLATWSKNIARRLCLCHLFVHLDHLRSRIIFVSKFLYIFSLAPVVFVHNMFNVQLFCCVGAYVDTITVFER